MRSKRGQSVLYTVLFLPTLILVFGLAIDIGMLQLQKLHLRWALDMATVDAATVVDAASYTQTGRLRLDEVRAPAVAREYLYRNLVRLGSSLGGDSAATEIARSAEIAVTNQVPAPDPFSGVVLDRPAVSARIQVPYRTSFLHIFLGRPDVLLTITADAEIKR